MLLVEGFQKFAGIPLGISRIFESLMPQQISANRRKNRSTQVKVICRQIEFFHLPIKYSSFHPEAAFEAKLKILFFYVANYIHRLYNRGRKIC